MRFVAIIAAGIAAMASPASAITYGNAGYAQPQAISPFGTLPGASPTYGQVFVSPVAGTLSSFSFTLTGSVGQIFAGVGAWTGGYNYTAGRYENGVYVPAGGSPVTLWESGYVTSRAGLNTFTMNVPILDLTKYVAYISVYNSPDADGATSLVLGDNNNPALRYFTFDNGMGSPSGNPGWTNYDLDVGDALFSFTVTNPTVGPVPEPAQWALLIGGFGLVGAVARRRRSGVPLAA